MVARVVKLPLSRISDSMFFLKSIGMEFERGHRVAKWSLLVSQPEGRLVRLPVHGGHGVAVRIIPS